MRVVRTVTLFSWMLSASPVTFVSAQTAMPAAVSLLIRTDDIGMSHSVNMAMQKLVSTGMPISVSVLFVCPWYQEAVEILKQHPNVSVGIHLALNSEWKNYRWGPVAGSAAVPSLVDENGFFFPSSEALYQHNPSVAGVEKELRAQIDRALRSGVKIDYVDEHMGTATRYPGALLDMNTDQPLPDMSKNRQGELTALTSQRFNAALKARNVVLVTYRDLIAREGLQSMRRPVE